MGNIVVHSETTKKPVTLAGEMAGLCWGANVDDEQKNFKRGLDCIESGHGRVMEFPQVYLIIDEYSARVIREFERHIGGAPTFLQESTRYIDYSNFNYVIPPSIKKNSEALNVYNSLMSQIKLTANSLGLLGIPKEDIGMIYPLAMDTKIVHRTNLRNLYDMAQVRECSRAYWEFRDLFKAIKLALSNYSNEWNYLINDLKIFKPKCEIFGYCNEKKSCGKYPRKGE